MRKIRVVFAIALSAMILGCPARFLQPLFSGKDITYNPALVGAWGDGEDTYTFKKANDNNYEIFFTEQKPNDITGHLEVGSDTMSFIGQLGRLGKTWFLDTYPTRETDDFHLLPTHIIFKMQLEGDTLRLASLEGDWLKKTIKTHHLKVQYALVNGDIIMTGPTREIQEIVRGFANDPNAFPNPERFARIK